MSQISQESLEISIIGRCSVHLIMPASLLLNFLIHNAQCGCCSCYALSGLSVAQYPPGDTPADDATSYQVNANIVYSVSLLTAP